MSWLLFLDESGHDHNSMPYEVRGGIALQDMKAWPFVQGVQRLELECFGVVRLFFFRPPYFLRQRHFIKSGMA